MGHSEPVSGIAGIMKAVLALEHGIIPPTVGFVDLNPNSKLWRNLFRASFSMNIFANSRFRHLLS